MNVEKSNWSSNGNRISLSIPFAKVNKENRTVSGFATLNNVDEVGDVVLADASLKAFEKFRGNLREMHQPIAVGKVVSFKPETFFDPQSKEFYDGVWVSAYISKGAQDTWEKVLDGTLSGFSIGGRINDADVEVNKSNGQSVRFIKDYDLVELSLVDSPANQLCNVLSIEKVNGQLVYKGMAADVIVANVFHCESDNIVVSDSNDTRVCSLCNKDMEVIGWVENTELNKADAVRYVYERFINKVSRSAKEREKIKLPESTNSFAKQANTINEGGTIVSEATVEETVVETAPVEEAAPAAEETAPAEEAAPAEETPAEEAAPAAETEDAAAAEKVDQPDFAKMLGDLKEFMSETLNKATEANAQAVAEVKATFDAFSKSVEAQVNDLAEQNKNLNKSIEGIREEFSSVDERINAVESTTAVKKSSDLGGSQEFVKKSKWSGAFLGSVNDILK